MATVQERVQRGVDFLTETYGPDWRERVDVTTLDLNSFGSCVLGQLEGSWDLASEKFGERAGSDYGFDADADLQNVPQDFTNLQSEWTKVLTETAA